MYYLDTSVLAAYYYPEAISSKVENLMLRESPPSISALTEVELFSAVSRKVHEGSLHRGDGGRIVAKYLSHVDEGYYNKIALNSQHFRLARDWIGQFETSLRTLDALHLAVASAEELTLLTTDKVLGKSAQALGLEVMLI